MANIYSTLYWKYIVKENSVKVLYVRWKYMYKYIYIYILFWSAIIFHLKLVTDLKNNVFSLIIYEPCVAEKMVNEKIITVLWHINGLKVSQGYIWSVQVWHIPVDYKPEETDSVQRKSESLSGDGFGLLRSESGKYTNNKVYPDGSRKITGRF